MRTVGAAVIGEQSADLDAVALIKGEGIAQEGDGGFGLLIRQHLRERQSRVIIDGDVQGLGADGLTTARASAATVGAH